MFNKLKSVVSAIQQVIPAPIVRLAKELVKMLIPGGVVAKAAADVVFAGAKAAHEEQDARTVVKNAMNIGVNVAGTVLLGPILGPVAACVAENGVDCAVDCAAQQGQKLHFHYTNYKNGGEQAAGQKLAYTGPDFIAQAASGNLEDWEELSLRSAAPAA